MIFDNVRLAIADVSWLVGVIALVVVQFAFAFFVLYRNVSPSYMLKQREVTQIFLEMRERVRGHLLAILDSPSG